MVALSTPDLVLEVVALITSVFLLSKNQVAFPIERRTDKTALGIVFVTPKIRETDFEKG